MIDLSKLCRGRLTDIDKGIKNGIINSNDIVITTDTKEFVYINKDGTKDVVKSRLDKYNSVKDALDSISSTGSILVGQVVSILTNGKYIPHVVQKYNGVLALEPIDDDNIVPLSNSDIENILKNL